MIIRRRAPWLESSATGSSAAAADQQEAGLDRQGKKRQQGIDHDTDGIGQGAGLAVLATSFQFPAQPTPSYRREPASAGRPSIVKGAVP